jgi:lysyl-tRNA synthetase class I
MNDPKDEKIKWLEKELMLYKQNGAVGFYYELNRFVNKTVEVMRDKDLKALISSSEDDDDPKKFEKMMSLIKNAKDHLIDMAEIKAKFKLSGNEKTDTEELPFIESVAEKR